MINREAGQTFYEYVNGLRIDTAKELSRSPKGTRFTMLDIAHCQESICIRSPRSRAITAFEASS